MPKVEVLTTIDDVDKTALNDLSDDGFFTHEWFKTLETSKPFKTIPRYFVVYEKGELAAIAPCFIEYEAQYSTLEDLTPWMKRLRRAGNALGFSFVPPLICESPCSFHSRVLMQTGCDKKATLELLCKEIDKSCKKDKSLFSAFPCVSEFDDLLMTSLPNYNYTKVPFVDTAYLDIKWPTFEAYLENLTYTVRKNVRRELKKSKMNEIVVEQSNDIYQLSEIISDLHSNLFMKHKGQKSLLTPSFFKALSENARDKTRLFTARKNNTVIGFSLCIEHKQVMDIYIAGFDYEKLTKTDFTYFNTVFYEPIRTAIEEGFERIHFRSASLEAKLARGCRIEKTYLFLKCNVNPINHVLHQYARMKHRKG
jgi:predicted N-acyltransferase